MKKDKEWLKKEIGKSILSSGFDKLSLDMNIMEFEYLLDELDEPEVKQLDKKIKELDSYNDELIRDNNQLRNELDNQEVLSQEWIDKHAVEGDFRGDQQFWYGRFIEEEKVQNLLVPKQDKLEQTDTNVGLSKPVIPQFVAEWIEQYVKYGYDLYPALKKMENNARSWKRTYDWYRNNTLEFVLAYLTQEYEVEKDKKYFIIEPVTGQFLIRDDSQSRGVKWVDGFSTSPSYFTETEIKAIDKRYWEFAEEVAE